MTDETPAPLPLGDDQPEAPAPRNGRGRWLALALLLVGVGLVVLFGLRSVRSFRHFDAQRGSPISQDLGRLRPWMTLPDIARDFEVPLSYLYETLDVAPRTPDRRTLIDLNRLLAAGQRGVFETKVRGAIEAFRRPPPHEGQPPSPLPGPDDGPPLPEEREQRAPVPQQRGAP